MAADLRKPVSGRTSWDAASWAAEASEDMDSWREASRRLLGEIDGKPVAVRRRIGVETLSMLTPEDLEAFRSKLVCDAYAKGAGSARAKAEAGVSAVLARVSDRWGAFASVFRAPDKPRGDGVLAAVDSIHILVEDLLAWGWDTLRSLTRRSWRLMAGWRRIWTGAVSLAVSAVYSDDFAEWAAHAGVHGGMEFLGDAFTLSVVPMAMAAMWVFGKGDRTDDLAASGAWLLAGVWLASAGGLASHALEAACVEIGVAAGCLAMAVSAARARVKGSRKD